MILNYNNHYREEARMSSVAPTAARALTALGIAMLLAACSDGATAPEAVEPIRTLTVDASTSWGYANLQGDTARLVSVADPAASADWDLGFMTTAVALNGGDAGPGGAVAYCVCQNAAATDADLQTMTPATELGDFEAVTAASIPDATGGWSADVFGEKKWYRYNLAGNHQIWPTYDVYLVKRGSEIYKIQLIGYYGPAGETRQITFRYVRLAH
jgi:hypothetical protein